MNPIIHNIVTSTLKSILLEQASAPAVSKETDNSAGDAGDSPFTPAESKFLGKFDAYGSRHIGIIYSISDIGIREFIMRSGKDLNLTPDILLNLIKNKIIKVVPYSGWGRNDDYTLELQLSLDDINGLGDADKEAIEKGSDASGAPGAPEGGAPSPEPAAGPEVSWVVKYGDILTESAKIVKKLAAKSPDKNGIYVKDSRILKTLPTAYVKHLERLILVLNKKKHTMSQKQRLIADILDNLAINFNITNSQIVKSFNMFKQQAKLKKYLKDK